MDSYGSGCDPVVVVRAVNLRILQDVEIFLTIIRSGCLWSGKNNDRQEICVVTDYMTAHAICGTCEIRVRVESQHKALSKILPPDANMISLRGNCLVCSTHILNIVQLRDYLIHGVGWLE
jgi:hypothetical protein